MSSAIRVLKSGLKVKLARPAILTQAKSLPTKTDNLADGNAIEFKRRFLRRHSLWRCNLNYYLLQHEGLVKPAGHQAAIAAKEQVHCVDQFLTAVFFCLRQRSEKDIGVQGQRIESFVGWEAVGRNASE